MSNDSTDNPEALSGVPKVISNKQQIAILLIAIISVGTFLRLYRLGSNSLWLDEAMSVWFANQSLGDILLTQPGRDVHPPFYYLLLSLWIRAFGDGEFQVRFLSAIFGTLSIPLLYLIVKNLFGDSPALVSALILSLSPFHIYYSQEARMYSSLTFFVLLSIFFMVKMLCIGEGKKRERKTTLFYSVGYIISTVAALYCHNTALFLPIAQNLFFLTFWNRHKALLKVWTLSGAVILILWAPWASSFFKQGSSVQKNFYAPPLTSESVANVFAIFNSGPAFWLFNWIDVGYFNFIHGRLVLLTSIFFGSLFLIGVVCMRHNLRPLVFLLLIFFIPVGAQVLISVKRPILATQTLIWASVPYYILIAKGITSLRNKWVFALAIGLFSTFSSASLYKYYTEFEKERWDLAAQYVAEDSDKEDLVLFSSSLGQIPFNYYFARHGRLPEEHGVPKDLNERKMTWEDLPGLEKLIQDRKRIWLIYSHEWFTDPERLSMATLEKKYCLLKKRNFTSGQSNIICYLFEKCNLSH